MQRVPPHMGSDPLSELRQDNNVFHPEPLALLERERLLADAKEVVCLFKPARDEICAGEDDAIRGRAKAGETVDGECTVGFKLPLGREGEDGSPFVECGEVAGEHVPDDERDRLADSRMGRRTQEKQGTWRA